LLSQSPSTVLGIPFDVSPLWQSVVIVHSVHRYFINTLFQSAKHLFLIHPGKQPNNRYPTS